MVSGHLPSLSLSQAEGNSPLPLLPSNCLKMFTTKRLHNSIQRLDVYWNSPILKKRGEGSTRKFDGIESVSRSIRLQIRKKKEGSTYNLVLEGGGRAGA